MKPNRLTAALACAVLSAGLAAAAAADDRRGTGSASGNTTDAARADVPQRLDQSTLDRGATPARGNALGTSDTRPVAMTGAMADQQFLGQAMASSAAEVELGRIAERRASSAEVRRYGEKMQMDHADANRELARLHAAHGPAAVQPTREQQRRADELRRLDGPAFDAAYAREMVRMHREDVERFERASSDLTLSAEVRQAAQTKLPVLREHLRQAEQLENRVAAGDLD